MTLNLTRVMHSVAYHERDGTLIESLSPIDIADLVAIAERARDVILAGDDEWADAMAQLRIALRRVKWDT